ncbi:MAG: ParB/RepB/Spo0J family partition protein [Acidimicrobiia bacterium]|nr:ParB/RepB/Spo0J family partition protein [Acidimicrobiia bacterium]
MAARKSGLGRGLDALIPVDRPGEGFTFLPVDQVVPNPQQPRQRFDEEALDSLAASIREVGVLQPIVVRPAGPDGSYVLVAGERRCRAARRAGLDDIPAMIRPAEDAPTTLAEALIENVQREDLSPLEEAAGYRALLEDFGMTHEIVAARVGKSRSAVSNTLRLLQLPAAIQGMLERGELSAGHARALLTVDDDAYAAHVAEKAAAEGWSVRQVEDAVRARVESGAAPRAAAAPPMRPAAIIELEQRLADELGSKVKITYGKRGGKLMVNYGSLDDLERIYRRIFG